MGRGDQNANTMHACDSARGNPRRNDPADKARLRDNNRREVQALRSALANQPQERQDCHSKLPQPWPAGRSMQPLRAAQRLAPAAFRHANSKAQSRQPKDSWIATWNLAVHRSTDPALRPQTFQDQLSE
jgi:hypothetical protein